jgi:hypothetical protein
VVAAIKASLNSPSGPPAKSSPPTEEKK